MAESKKVHALLWAPGGSGRHYSGPGMSAFRLYEKNSNPGFSIELLHGSADQLHTDVFSRITKLCTLGASPGSIARFLFEARKWLKNNHDRIDVFHGLQAFHPTVLPAYWAESLGIPAAVKVAAFNTDLAIKGRFNKLLGLSKKRREYLNRISAVISISDEITEELHSYGIDSDRIVYIPNAVRTEIFKPVESSEAKSRLREKLQIEDRPTIVFSGSLIPRKRPHLLIEALHILKLKNIDAQALIIGPHRNSEAYMQSLHSLADDLALSDHIFFTGFVSDLTPYYQASDIFCLPSKNEGLPNAMLEAMASGLPSVVTPFSGAKQLIGDHERGVIVEPESNSLAAAIKQFLYEDSFRLETGHNAREFTQRVFRTERVLNEHIQLFERIMEGKPATNL